MDIETNHLKPVLAPNLRTEIEKEMRDAILNGAFKPGERLVESLIAERLGVSRPPVREVLSALEREGLVVNIPRRGSFVVDFTDKDIEEIYSLRLLLEIGAIRRALPNFGAAQVLVAQKMVDDLGEQAIRRDNFDALVDLDFNFHEYIFFLAKHNRLFLAWKSNSMQTRLLIGITSKTYDQYPQQPKESHQEILNAIAAKNLALVEKTLTVHILDAQDRAMKGISKYHQKD